MIRHPLSTLFLFFSVLSVSLWLILLSPSLAQADVFYPMVMSVNPVAVQAGQTTECVISARYNLHGAYQVFVTGEGVVGEVDPPEPVKVEPGKPAPAKPQVNKLKVRFKVAPDALLGVRDVRVATPQGVSTLGQIVVARDPIVREAANNDTLKTAQAITLPATVCGTFEKVEDVDVYKFNAQAGQGLTFHVQSQRLQNRIHDLQEHADPIITLRNASGTVLAANDNYFFGDPLLHYKFAAAGEYFLDIRDARYGGNGEWQYAIEIHDRPFVTNVLPSRVTPGTTARLKMIGFNLPADPVVLYPVPANMPEGLQWAMLPLANGARTNAVPIIVSRLPEFNEAPGNHGTAATAQKVPSVPAGICGAIDKEGEIDCYAFEAKAGERFTFRIVAREHQSALDSVIRILNEKGDRLGENDDFSDRFVHADSRIENWTVPANGKYVIEVRDMHLRGGPAFVYLLEVTRSDPYFYLEMDTDKTLLAPGLSNAIFVRAVRKNGFEGEIQLNVEGLPAGVSAVCGKILPPEPAPPGRGAPPSDGCIMLKAAPTAPQSASNIRITGSATHKVPDGKTIPLTAVARPLQEVYMPGGGRYHYPVDIHTVSVGSELLDIRSVKITPTAISLKPGEAKKIDVTIERAPGFKGNVTLDVIYQHLGSNYGNSLPPGVTVDDKNSKTLLTGDQVQGHITLKAAADAKEVQNQQVAVMAHVSINFVMKFTYCGEPLMVTVAK